MKYILFSSKSYNIVNFYQGKNYALCYGLNCALIPQILKLSISEYDCVWR